MAVTIKQVEALPESYPAIMTDHGLDDSFVWQRIESYIAYRFSPRSVIWTVEECGEWEPPLTPATVTRVDVWKMGTWSEITPAPSPYGGYEFAGSGPFRITATVGGGFGVGDIPDAVQEAYRRLSRYSSAISRVSQDRLMMRRVQKNSYEQPPIRPTPHQESQRMTDVDGSADFVTNWTAKALQLSGAADLLRPYRRA